MKDFIDKVTVITGGASGIGLGIARLSVKKGMKTIIADIEVEALENAKRELEAMGGEILSVVCDVSKLDDVKNLADNVVDNFGEVHLLVNNAGVGSNPFVHRATLKDYEWVIGVNLWGVIYGVNIFLPYMMEMDKECYIINTSSGYGISAGDGPYGISKFGVTALSEMLAREMDRINSKVKVGLIIPGVVNTNIINSSRNRPEEKQNPEQIVEPEVRKMWDNFGEKIREMYERGMSPDILAEIVFNAMEKELFYIFCDIGIENAYKARYNAMVHDMKYLKDFIKKSKYPKKEFHWTESLEKPLPSNKMR
jgi:NAD(P)-dependent dehydrogenase (short-subunit alcohol dehydrogenase family)